METSDLNANPAPAPAASDAQLRALLLHRIGGDQAAALEQCLITEDGLAERLRHVEYDLLDAYARGCLRTADRAAVRQYLLRTARDRDRLRLARLLAGLRPPGRAPAPLPRWLQAWPGRLALAAGLAAAAVAVTLTLRLPHPGSPSAAAPAAQTQAAGYTLSLLADVSRGLEADPIRIPPGTANLRLQAELEQGSDAAIYELRVLDSQGKVLQQVQGLKLLHAGSHAYVEASVAASTLRPGLRRFEVRPQAGAAPLQSWTVDAGG